MKDTTRRGFLAATGVGAAAVGATALTPGLASAAPAAAAAPAAGTAAAAPAHFSGQLVAHISDTRSGTISLMFGEREVIVHDRALVARLVAASK